MGDPSLNNKQPRPPAGPRGSGMVRQRYVQAPSKKVPLAPTTPPKTGSASDQGDVLKKLQRELNQAMKEMEEQEALTSAEIAGLRRAQKAEARKTPHLEPREGNLCRERQEGPHAKAKACELPPVTPRSSAGLAATIAGAKETVRAQLRGAQRLGDVARRASIRRLQVQWHPDKNRDDPELATAVFQFIQEEKALLGL